MRLQLNGSVHASWAKCCELQDLQYNTRQHKRETQNNKARKSLMHV